MKSLPLVTSENTDGKLRVVAVPQMPCKLVALSLDGDDIELTDPHVYLPGERIVVPTARAERQSRAAFKVEFMRSIFSGNEIVGDLSTGPLVHALPRKTAEEWVSGLIGATLEYERKASRVLLRPGCEMRFELRPEEPMRIRGVKVQARAICGTCSGAGVVGPHLEQEVCPRCKADKDYVEPRRPRLVSDGVFVGVNLQFGDVQPVPVEALATLHCDDAFPGLLVHVGICNRDTCPVEVSGDVLYETIETKPAAS